MHYTRNHFILPVIGIFIILSLENCKTKPNSSTTIQQGSVPAIVTFSDSLVASKAIIEDDIDGFFDQISVVDMSIQMKNDLQKIPRLSAIKIYKSYLQKEVSNWTFDEKLLIAGLMDSVKLICDKISPRIFPGGIKMIKIKTNHYGNDVYYTRGKNILLPENIFSDTARLRQQIPVLLHEVFHILSRYNKPLREDLYRLIDFVPINKTVKPNPILKQKLLTNPDGVTMQYGTHLKDDNSLLVVPLISSKFETFKKEIPVFFDYLHFDIYLIEDRGSYYEIVADDKGNTTTPIVETPRFFKNIKDNTQYIIHPDEILADNFMLALLANHKNEYDNFSIQGKQLIEDVLSRLRKE